MQFTEFGLDARLVRAIEDLGYSTPTPIQAEAIPPAMAGRDVLAAAMTGSGKTAAFLLPILHRLLQEPKPGTRVLVLTPTRELAAQILEACQGFARHAGVSAAAVFGGVGMGPQEDAFRRGVTVLIATPGRLLDHLSRPYAKLDRIDYLVLDEADRMLDMGFLPDVRRVLSRLPARRQTMFFSATLPPEVRTLSRDMLQNAAAINVERQAAPAKGITQAVYAVSAAAKSALLAELLKRDEIGSVIVFTRTKHRTNRLSEYLEKHGIPNARMHGNRSQGQRTAALADFKSGKIRVLCATDIVARGIDVEALEHVVNFDVPHIPADYIHRVGRTARADAIGEAFTFVSPEEEMDMRAIEKAIGARVERRALPDFDYNQRPTEALEIPIGQRIAEIRQRKSDDRARANARRGPGPGAPRSVAPPLAPNAGPRRDDRGPRRDGWGASPTRGGGARDDRGGRGPDRLIASSGPGERIAPPPSDAPSWRRPAALAEGPVRARDPNAEEVRPGIWRKKS
ncbi:MAG: DEAD/DEAH box helicase [Myxococcales bacterium]|nr:DEAD/DEAH box helicase [Myxococcales bacterium]